MNLQKTTAGKMLDALSKPYLVRVRSDYWPRVVALLFLAAVHSTSLALFAFDLSRSMYVVIITYDCSLLLGFLLIISELSSVCNAVFYSRVSLSIA